MSVSLSIDRVNLCLRSETQLFERNLRQRSLPVTIITGFLGSGKTSLVRHILNHRQNLNIACAVSDLADINIDKTLVSHASKSKVHAPFFHQDIYVAGLPVKDNIGPFKEIVYDLSKEGAIAERPFDWLVVETSGAADPCTLISAVEETFGKMTRAKLDSVITVVDVETLVLQKGNVCRVLEIQLQCADVVLLNKMDLIGENIDQAHVFAREFVFKHAPNARVYETKYCEISLPLILDISAPKQTDNAVAHERTPLYWTVNPPLLDYRNKHSISVASTIPLDFQSVTYEQLEPITLHGLHLFLTKHWDKGSYRLKGVFYFAEDVRNRYIIQISGRRRLHVENSGPWSTTPKISFVLIGDNTCSSCKQSEFEDSLKTLFMIPFYRPREPEKTVIDRFVTDQRFEIEQIKGDTLYFRITCPIVGFDEVQLKHRHAIDLNELNLNFVREFNFIGKNCPLLYTQSKESEFSDQKGSCITVIASLSRDCSVVDVAWKELDDIGRKYVDKMKMEISKCKCGF